MDLDDAVRPSRRRGAELETALIEAAWDELVAGGYDAFTFEGVAARAGTSRPVIYRRWPDKPSLVRAALVHGFGRDRVEIPDTGSLREDLIELLRRANTRRAPVIPLMSVLIAGYFQATGTTFAELHRELVAGRTQSIDVLIERAVARGELDRAPSPRVTALPFDLFRHQLLMTLAPLTEADILGIVDEVFLPLARGAGPVTRRSRGGGPRSA